MYGPGFGWGQDVVSLLVLFVLPGVALMVYVAVSPRARECLIDMSFTQFLTTRSISFLYGLSLAVAVILCKSSRFPTVSAGREASGARVSSSGDRGGG